jgi:predicted phosphate transport protein (TIGR00153 family)
MALQDLIRLILPREDRFYELIERQMDVALRASRALAEFRDPACTPAMLAASLQKLEHEGDALVHEIEELLAKTFVTPIDREDIHQLSQVIDDVTDLANGAARACDLLGVPRPSEEMLALIDMLGTAAEQLARTLPNLRLRRFEPLMTDTRAVRGLEKDADRIFRGAISKLYRSDDVDVKVLLREREVLEDLENAVDRCERVAMVLATLAVKHG